MEFSTTTIEGWRSQARELWMAEAPKEAPKGWSICPVDPAIMLPAFPKLFLLPGFRLQAYQYRWGRDGHALVYALPAGQELESPPSETQQPLQPANALPDVMQAMGGDGSLESYMQASILGREFQEFGALGHGRTWSFASVLGKDPWSDPGAVSPSRATPAGPPQFYSWSQKMPPDFLPRAEQAGAEIKTTFFTYTGLDVEKILWNEDLFQTGAYSYRSSSRVLAQGNQGYHI